MSAGGAAKRQRFLLTEKKAEIRTIAEIEGEHNMKKILPVLALCAAAAVTMSGCIPFILQNAQPSQKDNPVFSATEEGSSAVKPTAVAATKTAPVTTAPATESATIPVTDVPTTAAVIQDLSYYVETADEYEISYSGAFLLTNESTREKTTVPCRLPHLTIESADARAINEEIEANFGKYFREEKKYLGSSDFPHPRMDYVCYLNGTILSLVTECRTTSTPDSMFGVYNIDVLTGFRLGNADLTDAHTDASLGEAYGKVRDAIEARFESLSGMNVDPTVVQRAKERSFDQSNIDASRFYFNGDGYLCAAYRFYWVAGAENYGDVAVFDIRIK